MRSNIRMAPGIPMPDNFTAGKVLSKDSSGIVVAVDNIKTIPFIIQYPASNADTNRIYVRQNCAVTQIDCICKVAPSAHTTLKLYKNSGVEVASFQILSGNTTAVYDVSPDHTLSAGDYLYVAISGGPNGVVFLTVQVSLAAR